MSGTLQTLDALAKFFIAAKASELEAAYYSLVEDDPLHPTASIWQDVEFSFNRLFIGPRAVIAPPYASVYLDSEPRLMGNSTLNIRYLYHAVGLASPWENHIPDDHLSLELDALRQLLAASERIENNELFQLSAYLLAHLRQWTPYFIQRVRSAPETHPLIGNVVDRLEDILRPRTIDSELTGLAARSVSSIP